MCGSCLGCLLLPWWFWIEEPFTSLDDNFPVKLIDFAGKNSWVPFESDLLRYCAPWVHPSVSGDLKIQASRVPLLSSQENCCREDTRGSLCSDYSGSDSRVGLPETATGSPLSGPHFGTFSWWSAVSILVITFVLPLRWTNVINLCSPSPLGTEGAPQCIRYTFLYVCPS